MVSCVIGVFCSFAVQASDTISWLTSVPEGYFSDAANWTGSVIPTNNTIGTFSGNQTYTVHFPAGGYAENSATKVALSSDRSLTFDTRGTWWLKDAPTITNGWPNSWTGFQIANSSGSHVFNIEGLETIYTATNYPIMCLSNAVFRYYSYSAVVTNVLEEGLLNLYDPKGVIDGNHSLITGAAGTRHVAIFKTNSTLRANQVRMRGNAYGNFMIFEGGDHAIYNSLQLGEGATNAGYTNTVQVTGGTLSLPTSTLYIGNGKTGSYADFSVSGDGALNVTNNIVMANTAQSSAALRLSDNAVLRTGTYIDAAYNSSSTATVSLAGSARLSVGSNLAVARGAGSFTTMDMGDQSSCTAGGYLLIGGYSASDGTVTVRDGAVLSVAGYVEAGTSSGTGRLELAGGRLVAKNVRGGAGGWSELHANGGTLCASNISASVNLLVNFDVAELGASGLTLDTAGYDATVGQAFADASGADGLFLKTGVGTLSVSNSTHALTVVAQGGLRLLNADATFGRSLVVTNQATLSLAGSSTNLTVGALTLGETGAPVSLYLDTGDLITVTNSGGLAIADCGLFYGSASVNGTYPLFHCSGSVDASVLNHLTVYNPTAGKDYVFAVVPDGADSVIQLTVAELAVSDAIWNGSLGSDWNTADNWTPASLPTNSTRVFFTDAGAQKTVNLSAAASVASVNFDSASSYLLQGSQLSLPAGSISNNLGSHTIDAPLALAGSLSVRTTSASTTTVSGTISAVAVPPISKSGSGTLFLAGNNAGFGGAWTTTSGRLTFASSDAWGADSSATNAVTVNSGTLTSCGPAATITKGIALDSGNVSNTAILDAQSDLTVNGKISVASGIFCKRGAGTLTFNIGNGTVALSAGNGSGGVNITPAGTITFPDTGDSPALPTGLGGFNVAEGTLRIRGNGPSASIVNQLHFGLVGCGVISCLADPTLELDAVRMNQGGAGLHFIIGNQISSTSIARSPTLRMINGATLSLDTIRLGYQASAPAYTPTLIMSNASLTASFNINIGYSEYTPAYVRLTQGSSAIATGGSQWGGGIYVGRTVDVVVAESSVLGQTSGAGSFRFSDSTACGSMRWESGGIMRFGQFLGYNYNTASGLNMYFNGGVMDIVATGESASTATNKQSFIIEDGGMTLRVGSGIRHTLHFPINGIGALTKTGSGEAVFGAGWSFAPNATNLSGLATGNYTGGTTIQEGTLSVSNGTIRSDAVVAVATNAVLNLCGSNVTLGEVSGSGTLTNGTLFAAYRCHVTSTNNDCLALADLTIPTSGLTVTFDPDENATLTNRQVLAVATCSGATTLNLEKWKANNVGDKLKATFSLVNTTVYATVSDIGGMLIRIQ